ncbi:MAG: hypothetical protein A4E53_04530 [Pelotomaculum sp. PtaB.Bin104]|nr:MAG: hypothetical protein A4E53_04530 [Pelotomaculum sp. PtaB.Bin104]
MEQQTEVEAQGTIQEIHHHAPLTSSELALLWRTNLYYTMIRCIHSHFVRTANDPDLRTLIENGLSICETRINKTSQILKMEGQPIPKGFGDKDIDLGAPRLFTDLYYYFWTLSMIQIGLMINGKNLSHSTREDVRNFYTEALSSTTRYYNWISEVMLKKGIYIRSPIINTCKEADTVEKQNFLRGFLGERRPLLAEEIDFIFFGIRNNQIGGALTTGFQQVARSEQVRAYMARGAEIAKKHVEIFSKTLRKENLQAPMHSGELLTDSTIPPYSNMLMMQHVVVLNGIGIGNYATAMASSLRHDLSINYMRLIAETANYGEDGINIMIENRWFEEPPRIIDRRELAKEQVH